VDPRRGFSGDFLFGADEQYICGATEVEFLRASPVNTTGVQTPDLIGCPQNDNHRPPSAGAGRITTRTICSSETSGTVELVRTE